MKKTLLTMSVLSAIWFGGCEQSVDKQLNPKETVDQVLKDIKDINLEGIRKHVDLATYYLFLNNISNECNKYKKYKECQSPAYDAFQKLKTTDFKINEDKETAIVYLLSDKKENLICNLTLESGKWKTNLMFEREGK